MLVNAAMAGPSQGHRPGLVQEGASKADSGTTASMLQTLTNLALANPQHASEIVGAYGQARLTQAGEQRHVSDLPKNIVSVLVSQPGGNEAVKNVLRWINPKDTHQGTKFDQIKGTVDGYAQAAKMRLDFIKPRAGTPGAPDTMVPVRTSPINTKKR